MIGPLKLAWRYVRYYWGKTLILIAAIFLTAFLPLVVRILLDQFNVRITQRASATPLVLGARGSRLDLTLHALYFQVRAPGTVAHGLTREIESTGWATAVPLYSVHSAHGYPVVGTSLEYFSFRGLTLEQGDPLLILGDCVLGANVARQLELAPGDTLITDRENVVDIAGKYPLKLHVRGVLRAQHTSDDWAVFVDLKTAWVIDGLGHGHQNLEQIQDEGLVASREGGVIVARASVLPYLEITEENIDSFHFHGDVDSFPLTAVIAVPPDTASETKLLGRYLVDSADVQIVQPIAVIQELMGLVFQVKKFFDLNALLVSLGTLALLVLVLMLSVRLRKREMETLFKLGCRRGTMAVLILGEVGIILLVSAVLLVAAVWLTTWIAGDLVQRLLVGA